MRGEYHIYIGTTGKEDVLALHTPNGTFLVPMKIMDQIVVMRYAQLKKEKKDIDKYEAKVAKRWQGNFGVDALCKKLGMETGQEWLRKQTLKKLESIHKGK